MILAISLGWALDSAPPRARTELLIAAWERAHGHDDTARAAARTALLHDPAAAAPRLLLAELDSSTLGTADARLVLLEEAARAPGASARVWTALALARRSTGHQGADLAFETSERLGGGSANYAAWLPTLSGRAADHVSERWLLSTALGPEGEALRATFATATDGSAGRQLCSDALSALLLQQDIAPRVIATRCGAAGRAAEARLALGPRATLGPAWTEALALLDAWPSPP